MKKIVAVILLFLPLCLLAQADPFAVRTKTQFNVSGLVGYEKVDSVKYYKLRLIQEFNVWKVGVGLDLDFLFDKDYHLKEDDWDNLDNIVDKIYYIKYGLNEDPFYCHVGGFPSLTQGNGLIMNNYSNMKLYPDMHNVGVQIGIKPNLPTNPSFDLFMNDIRHYQIMSFAAQCKPFPDSTVKILDQIVLGMSFVFDRNQYGNLKYIAPDSLSDLADNLPARSACAYGFGYTLPLIQTDKVILGQYAEIAHIQDYGTGFILPGIYTDFHFLKINLEYRIYSDKFTPGFFDSDYEEERGIINPEYDSLSGSVELNPMYKELTLRGLKASQGWSGKIQGIIGKKLKAMFAWQNTFGDEIKNAKSMWFKVWVDSQYKRLENFSLYYNKTKVNDLALELPSPNTEIGTSLTFRVSEKRWYVIGKYEESYKDKDNSGEINWLRETKRSFGLGVKYVF